MKQIKLHKKIDRFFSNKPKQNQTKSSFNLILKNYDARQYFCSKANEKWLDWLWNNDFFKKMQKKTEKFIKYNDFAGELEYLVRMIKKNPQKVTDIILSFEISFNNVDSEIIDELLRMSLFLPSNQLIQIVNKIHKEKWVVFTTRLFAYEKMFKKLFDNKQYSGLLLLAEAVLEIKLEKNSEQKKTFYVEEDYFYINNFFVIKVFEYFLEADNKNIEKALEILCNTLSKIINFKKRAPDKHSVFIVRDPFSFFDVDLFEINWDSSISRSSSNNIKMLLISIVKLVEKIFDKNNKNNDYIIYIYNKYFNNLPDTHLIFRLKLFVMSFFPKVFQNNLKKIFLRLFIAFDENKNYFQIQYGTEYKKALKKSFPTFDFKYQNDFIVKTFQYFGNSIKNKEQNQFIGWEILSSICNSLSINQKKKCKKIFKKECDLKFLPKSVISWMASDSESLKEFISQKEFNKFSISDIVKKLKTEWTEKKLTLPSKNENFFSSFKLNEIISKLHKDIVKRPEEYLLNANLFFDKKNLDAIYTIAFFDGICKFIDSISEIQTFNWSELINVMLKIIEFKNELNKNINYFFCSILNILRTLFVKNDFKKPIIALNKHRKKLFKIITHLIEINKLKNEKSNSINLDQNANSPLFDEAFSTVHGLALEVFIFFTWHSNVNSNNQNKNKIEIEEDFQKVYEELFKKKKDLVSMYLFGYYFPTFYFRYKNWINQILPIIFPFSKKERKFFWATWAGYLHNTTYKNIFFNPEFNKIYKKSIELENENLNDLNLKKINQNLISHIAPNFIINHKQFKFDDELFIKFWEKNIERKQTFISLIGTIFISNQHEWAKKALKKDSEIKMRLIKLWEWVLENCDDHKIFENFYSWIKIKNRIFDSNWLVKKVRETLEKSKGVLNLDYNFEKEISKFTEINPEETFKIIRLFLFEGKLKNKKPVPLSVYLNEKNIWTKIFKNLCNNPKTKKATYELINDLIREGSKPFWKFKKIIEKEHLTSIK